MKLSRKFYYTFLFVAGALENLSRPMFPTIVIINISGTVHVLFFDFESFLNKIIILNDWSNLCLSYSSLKMVFIFSKCRLMSRAIKIFLSYIPIRNMVC